MITNQPCFIIEFFNNKKPNRLPTEKLELLRHEAKGLN
jgi:hypothetical protein